MLLSLSCSQCTLAGCIVNYGFCHFAQILIAFGDALKLSNDGPAVIDPLMTGLKQEHILIDGAELEGKSKCQGDEGLPSVKAI